MPEMAQAPGAPAPAPEKGATELVTQIHSGLVKLMSLLGASSAIGDEDKQELAAIIDQYENFVQSKLGSPQAGPGKPPGSGNVPMETGGKPAMPTM